MKPDEFSTPRESEGQDDASIIGEEINRAQVEIKDQAADDFEDDDCLMEKKEHSPISLENEEEDEEEFVNFEAANFQEPIHMDHMFDAEDVYAQRVVT